MVSVLKRDDHCKSRAMGQDRRRRRPALARKFLLSRGEWLVRCDVGFGLSASLPDIESSPTIRYLPGCISDGPIFCFAHCTGAPFRFRSRGASSLGTTMNRLSDSSDAGKNGRETKRSGCSAPEERDYRVILLQSSHGMSNEASIY
jgi:hypothetical protein